jgi:hypothetical protein
MSRIYGKDVGLKNAACVLLRSIVSFSIGFIPNLWFFSGRNTQETMGGLLEN